MTVVERYLSVLDQLTRVCEDRHWSDRAAELAAECDKLWNRMTEEEQAEVEKRLAK